MTLPVYSGGEDGLLGIALDEDFAENGYLYQYWSPASEDDTDPASFNNRLSRFTVTTGASGATTIDPASEKVLLEVPARRLPDEPGHTGGGVIVDHESGDLYLGVGDDVNPHTEPSGGYAPISERDGTFHDARATSANTNDLRGKVLRIHPEDDGTYSVPEGNLFPESEDDADKTLPEIYAMGFRNPFRFAIDPATGNLGVADYSPDSNTDNLAQRGPAGIAEWNLIKEPGFFGWPLCMGNNEPFRDVDYRTSPVTVGGFFDCDAPVNDSVRNTGLTELPPAQPADMWYGYQRSSVPGRDQPGRGTGADGRPVLRLRPGARLGHQVPRVLRGQGVLLRVVAEPGVHRGDHGPGGGSGRDGRREGQPVPAGRGLPRADRREVRARRRDVRARLGRRLRPGQPRLGPAPGRLRVGLALARVGTEGDARLRDRAAGGGVRRDGQHRPGGREPHLRVGLRR